MELMCHSSSFLLPPENPNTASSPSSSSSSSSSLSLTYALVVLNQNLPKFTPLLWDHGNSSCTFIPLLYYNIRFIHSFMHWLFILYSAYTSLRWWRCQPRVWWNASSISSTKSFTCSLKVLLFFLSLFFQLVTEFFFLVWFLALCLQHGVSLFLGLYHSVVPKLPFSLQFRPS